MKNYTEPEFEIKKFSMSENITTSGVLPDGGGQENAAQLKTAVAGNNAVSYGTQDVSIFD